MYGNRDQAHGLWAEFKGKVKRIFGRATGDRSTQLKGTIEEGAGKFQQGVGNLREDLKGSKNPPRATV